MEYTLLTLCVHISVVFVVVIHLSFKAIKMAALSFAFVFALIRSVVPSVCLSACYPVWPFIFLIFAQDEISCTFACHVFICFSSRFYFFAGKFARIYLLQRKSRGGRRKKWQNRSLQCADKSIRTDRLRGTCFAFQFSASIVYFAFTLTSTFISFFGHGSRVVCVIFIYEKITFIDKRFANEKGIYLLRLKLI